MKQQRSDDDEMTNLKLVSFSYKLSCNTMYFLDDDEHNLIAKVLRFKVSSILELK